MIYSIKDAQQTVEILADCPTGVIVFDLDPDVDVHDITVTSMLCGCCVETLYGIGEDVDEFCDEEGCEGYLDGSYTDLVIQGDKVLYRREV